MFLGRYERSILHLEQAMRTVAEWRRTRLLLNCHSLLLGDQGADEVSLSRRPVQGRTAGKAGGGRPSIVGCDIHEMGLGWPERGNAPQFLEAEGND
jgi:hypothetical protein